MPEQLANPELEPDPSAERYDQNFICKSMIEAYEGFPKDIAKEIGRLAFFPAAIGAEVYKKFAETVGLENQE